jgi:hypothetical protein
MWLVVVNEAGKWIGKIMGAPEGSNFAGSDGFQFEVGPNGEIMATNNGNGAGSTNNTSVSSNNNTNTEQNNTAAITNNLNLTANSGDNSASRNTGGNSNISTGDAKVVANLVNFVNNNITGGGKLFVTIVNVFGSWKGDLVTPGHEKEHKSQTASTDGSHQSNSNNNTTHKEETKTASKNNSNVVASTPTPTKTVITHTGNSNAGVLAAQTSGNNELTIGGNTGGKALTLGARTSHKVAGANAIKINLAWILIIIPLLPLFVLLTKKRAAILTVISRRIA